MLYVKRTHVHNSPLDKLVIKLCDYIFTYPVLEDLRDVSQYKSHTKEQYASRGYSTE